ncbi:DUF4166 domain-containing protein [Variovorax rhizosphaerae]|uniref:DUF4166 domain-containing protein n=1 Tax=Variovorax rhizosphaerae TaxID=1836200 RepID=A0ABU8WGE5_9BURK
MYERAMGDEFHRLDAAVQRFHRLAGKHELEGRVETIAPRSVIGKLLALCLGTPRRSQQGPIRFELDASPAAETWVRHFPGKVMASNFRPQGREIIESLGAARLAFELHERDGALVMRLLRMHFIGIPCPRWLMPRIVAEERGRHDRLDFAVSASVRLVGKVADYRGHLVLPSATAVAR